MVLKIILKNKTTFEIQLTQDGEVLDMLIMPLDFRFDTVLVTSIDKLLKRNRITRVSPLDILVEGFEDKSSMSFMIVKTVTEALKIK